MFIYIGFAYTKAVGIRSFAESNPAALFWVCFFTLLQSAVSLVCMWKQWFESKMTLFYQGANSCPHSLRSSRVCVSFCLPLMLPHQGFNLCMSFLCLCV